MTGGPKVRIAGFCFPEIQFVRIAVRKDYLANERKKGPAAPISDALWDLGQLGELFQIVAAINHAGVEEDRGF